MLDCLPSFAQERLVKALDYPYDYPDLDPYIKCLMAIQLKQGQHSFISEDAVQSRQLFDERMKAIQTKPTPVKAVEDLRLPLQNGTIFARHYHPAPQKNCRWSFSIMVVHL